MFHVLLVIYTFALFKLIYRESLSRLSLESHTVFFFIQGLRFNMLITLKFKDFAEN